jgi:LPPG:FO 2-phospho-L-lactate transferase
MSGGTGSSKLLSGLRESQYSDYFVVANVGDNFWYSGLYICPDIDTCIYALAGRLSKERRWGLEGDTFNFFDELKVLSPESFWFRLGDKDLATHVHRTRLLGEGKTLTEITLDLGEKLGAVAPVYPASDTHFETRIITSNFADIHLQEFWVKNRGRPEILDIKYANIEQAKPSPDLLKKLENSDGVLACPGNPISSIYPIVSVPGIAKMFSENLKTKPRVAISPIIGGRPVSGPAGKMMIAKGLEPNILGIAKLYTGYFDFLVIDKTDIRYKPWLEQQGFKVVVEDILFQTELDSLRLLDRIKPIFRGKG